MTDPQALELARRIVNRWRGSAPLNDWCAELAHLEHDPAIATFERLRGLLDDPGPGISRFKSEYRAITNVSNVHPHEWPTLSGPRLTREQREALLVKAGAKPELITNRRPV